jgi:hypothetical protein
MARKIIFKQDGINNQSNSPSGYIYVGYDGNIISEKVGSTISAIGGGGSGSYISDVQVSGSSLTFSSIGDAFSGGVDLSTLQLASKFGNTYFVAPDGDDTLGSRGDITKPFKTITGARDKVINDVDQSLVTGTTLVYVFPGEYQDEEIQYQDGNIYFSAGAKVTPPQRIHGAGAGVTAVNQGAKKFTVNGNWASELPIGFRFNIFSSTGNDGAYTVVSSTDVSSTTEVVVSETIPSATANGRLSTQMAIFTIGNQPLNGATLSFSENCRVFGDGEFFINKTLDNDWSGGFADCLSGIFYAEVDEINVIQGVAIAAYNSATCSFRGNFLKVTESGYVATARDNSDTTFEFERISVEGTGYTFLIRNGFTSNFNGFCNVIADKISVKDGWQAVALQQMNGGIVTVNCPQIRSTTSYVANISGMSGGDFIINGNLISDSTGGGIINSGSTGGRFVLNGDIINNTGIAYLSNASCTTNNEVYIKGDILIRGGNTQAITLNRGKLRLNGSILNTAGTHGVNMTGTANYSLTIDNLKIMAASYSITSTTAKNMRVIHSLASNVPTNLITNLVTGSNVIIDSNIN